MEKLQNVLLGNEIIGATNSRAGVSLSSCLDISNNTTIFF